VASRIVGGQTDHLFRPDWSDIRIGTFFSLVIGVALFLSRKAKARLERWNRELEKQITVGPGKFVTFFYGVIDRERLILHFENAGHTPPIVLRGGEATILAEGGTVLGLFPKSAYEERQFALRPGDCLLLTTDGVTEAADAHDEEFGIERVIASARAARSLGAQGIRTRILDEVTHFCNGNFHYDASLIVVTVD